MIPYTPVQLLFFFFVYCFVGWIIESSYVSFKTKKLTNRGFMHGPFIPIYGFGAMALLITGTILIKWPVAVFFGSLLVASILEFFTGMAMEAVFKVRYWDYSDQPFNICGHVCLGTSLCWGGLGVVLIYFLHKPVEALSNLLEGVAIEIIATAISIYFIVDLTLSFKAAFDMRAIIIKLEAAKKEMQLMEKRLDVMLAFASAGIEEQKDKIVDKFDDINDAIEDKFDDITSGIEERLTKITESIKNATDERMDSIKDEYYNLKAKYEVAKENQFGLKNIAGVYKRGMILGNPTMVSKKFKDSLEVIKKNVMDMKKKK